MAENAGAIIDRDQQRMKIPKKVMEAVIHENKEQHNHNKKDEMAKKLYGHISTQVQLVDYTTGIRRTGLMEDVYKGITLVENLDYIKECNAFVIPHDVKYDISDIISFQALYKYSTKPGGGLIFYLPHQQNILLKWLMLWASKRIICLKRSVLCNFEMKC